MTLLVIAVFSLNFDFECLFDVVTIDACFSTVLLVVTPRGSDCDLFAILCGMESIDINLLILSFDDLSRSIFEEHEFEYLPKESAMLDDFENSSFIWCVDDETFDDGC